MNSIDTFALPTLFNRILRAREIHVVLLSLVSTVLFDPTLTYADSPSEHASRLFLGHSDAQSAAQRIVGGGVTVSPSLPTVDAFDADGHRLFWKTPTSMVVHATRILA